MIAAIDDYDPGIDDIEDDAGGLDDTENSDMPGPSWVDCPMLPRRDMLAVIERHADLDGRSINLFRNALESEPRSDLFRLYIGPNLYQPGGYYCYTTPDPDRYRFRNWHPENTLRAIEHRSILACGLFSNTLSWIDSADLPPSQRAHNAGYGIYTIEFDGMPIDDQLRIIWVGKIKRIDAEFRRYRDYRGYEVVYSGGKSLHFHFVFDLRHLKHNLIVAGNSSYQDNWTRDLPDRLLRPAYALNWDRLEATFRDIGEVGFQADERLRSWEQLRRCPWALRLVNGAHPLGLPPGHLIRQPVLAASIFKNTPRGSTGWFHDPDKLGDLVRDEKIRRPTRPPWLGVSTIAVTAQEQELFEQHATGMFRQIIGVDYPRFAGFIVNDDGFRCHFYNNASDQNPSSFCEGNRSRILLQGRHDFDGNGVTIAATPNQIFDWIVAANTNHEENCPDDWIMRRYRATVTDRASLIKFLDEHMQEAMLGDRSNVALLYKLGVAESQMTHRLIRAPQGCGKSTTAMAKVPALHEADPGLIFFSSPSLLQTEEKIETFRRIHVEDNGKFVPFSYLSLTKLYERFCPAVDRISHIDVLEEGGSSWLRRIHVEQPEIYSEMFAYRCRLFDLIEDGKIPVLFGTHETMRQHADRGMTRIFYARDFSDTWFEPMPPADRRHLRNHLLGQNDIHRVIVDEITAHDLVTIHTHPVVEWVHRCADEIDFEKTEDIADSYAKFAIYLMYEPFAGMTWNVFRDVLNCEYMDEDVVEASGREVPFDETEGIYANIVGQKYFVRSRGWWNEFARVTLLTTEAVPTRIIEALDRKSSKRGEQQDDRFRVYDFTLPESSRDTVTVEVQRACKKSTLTALARAYHERYPEVEIISNMLKNRVSEFSVTTHASAKGSNAFVDHDIVAFYNAPSPALFGELAALNVKFDRSDLVRLFYLDSFEQTCGRNRGFRGREHRCETGDGLAQRAHPVSGRDTDHIAVFPPGLHRWLAPAMCGASYVQVLTRPSVTFGNQK